MKLSWKLTTSEKKDGVSMSIARDYTEWATFDDLAEKVMNDLLAAGETLAEGRAITAKKRAK